MTTYGSSFTKRLTLVIFVLMALGGLLLLAQGSARRGPIAFIVVWFAALGWNAYWHLLRIAHRLDYSETDGSLTWRAPLRSVVISMADVVAFRPFKLSSNIEVIETRDGRRYQVWISKGFRAFTEILTQRHPGISVRIGWQGWLVERMPGPSLLRRPRS